MLSIIEKKINRTLQKFPSLKKIIKRIYQFGMYSVSPKLKVEGNLHRISPDDNWEYFFGYYDKSPWDVSERYMLCLRAKKTYKEVAPSDYAEIVLFDTFNENSFEVLGKTRAWNVQQGCMLQWLGPDFNEQIIYNDFREGMFCSVILNVKTKKERVLKAPIYDVSKDGKYALTLDFSRLHRLRKGYGYFQLEDKYKDEKIPNKTCIWKINIENNKVEPLLKYTDFYNFETREEMRDAEHKVNHIMINPSGERFMVLHRWIKGNNRYTRLVTLNNDGSNMFNLSDDDMTSHSFWKNNTEILSFAHKKKEGNGYFIMEDKTNKYKQIIPELTVDGHPSFSSDNKKIITDTYPNRSRIQTIYLISNNTVRQLARVFAPFKYDNDVRCDLHPRWNRSGTKVAIDAVFEGKRGLYIINLD